jgi:YggT family protein
MTEREYYHENKAVPEIERREVYQETVVDHTGVPAADEVARDVYQERVYGPGGEQVVRSEHVSVPSEATRRAAVVSRINQVIYFVFGVINVLLALRFVLLMLGASEASPFVSLIYGLSGPFAAPFQGIFSEPAFSGSVVEWASLVGIIIYMLLAYGLTRLVALIYAPAYPTTDER